jgi:hypothetical protein
MVLAGMNKSRLVEHSILDMHGLNYNSYINSSSNKSLILLTVTWDLALMGLQQRNPSHFSPAPEVRS